MQTANKFHVSFINSNGSEECFVRSDQQEVIHWPHREQAMIDVNEALKSSQRNGRPVALVDGSEVEELFNE